MALAAFVDAVLKIGIKRKTHRRDDQNAAAADVEFAAVRHRALERSGHRCVDCGYKSLSSMQNGGGGVLQVHHINDNHADNREENLQAKSPLCHAYHHIGCDAASTGGHGGWSSRMRVAYAPDLSAADLNLLQMAIGVAMAAGGPHKEAAQAIYAQIMHLTRPVIDGWGSNQAKDFAAAMAQMSDGQYERRQVDDLRLIFHPDLLKSLADGWHKDYAILKPQAWSSLAR